MQGLYGDVIIEISHEKLDRPFQYKIPDAIRDELYPGARVEIPFGKSDRIIKGYLINISDKAEFPPEKMKEIIGLSSGIGEAGAEDQLIRLAIWMKRHYGGTLIQSLRVVFPVKKVIRPKEKKTVELLITPAEAESIAEECDRKHRTAQARLLSALASCGEMDLTLLREKLNVSAAVIRRLEEQKLVRLSVERDYRNPGTAENTRKKVCELTSTQQAIVDDFVKNYRMGLRDPSLLFGVTGSGKTEVYMEMISEVLKSGKQAIVLIPEIALTFQTVMRFCARFGSRVSYLHSKLSAGERYDQFCRAKDGEIDIMIGPRSALFTPFPDLGIIIIDEEHEGSYKAENMPKYHAREVALERARLANAALVFGSATPSVDSFYHAKRGEYRLYEIRDRISDTGLPSVYVADLREELVKGNRSMFSDVLSSKIRERLNNKEQIMLFLNRRGFAGFVSCRKCGEVMKCPHCDVSLSLHGRNRLVCHYCGYETPMIHKCPNCGSKYVGGMRAGTEQVEEMVHGLFPEARVLRMDADTTKEKGGYEKILSAFSNEEADILIGTQMIVKGHDFPKVTLVGILAADLSLYANDYRAGERTFQLLTQAAGRAGRADRPGEVVIQTYSPEHYSVAAAARQDYNDFYAEEIGYRNLMGYPPVSHMLKVLVEDKDPDRSKDMASDMANVVKSFGIGMVIGPAQDSIWKIKDIYRNVFYIRHADMEVLADDKDILENWRRENPTGSTQVQFDFDPM